MAHHPDPYIPAGFQPDQEQGSAAIENEGGLVTPLQHWRRPQEPVALCRRKVAKVDGGVLIGLGSVGDAANFCNGVLHRSFSRRPITCLPFWKKLETAIFGGISMKLTAYRGVTVESWKRY